MALLDQFESLRDVDRGGMAEILMGFPQRVDAAFAGALPPLGFVPRGIRSIAVVGLGGSAIGGDLATAALADKASVPIAVMRSAILPAWVGKDTLVVAVSYSGNTAEVCAAYKEAKRRECAIIAIASGGTLAADAARDGVPFIRVNGYPQPRLAVGDITIAMMKIMAQVCGLALEGVSEAVVRTLGVLQQQVMPSIPTEENPAKLLAYKLFDRFPVMVGGGMSAPAARRWKTQINENAKSICAAEFLPELFHNTIEGMKAPLPVADDSMWVLLDAGEDPAMPQEYWDTLAVLLDQQGIQCQRVSAPAGNRVAAQWWLVSLGDWVSYYLACLHGVDPMPVPTIQSCKSQIPISKSR